METPAQRSCALAVSVLNISQSQKDDIAGLFTIARADNVKQAVENSSEGLFKKLQKAGVPVHTTGEERDRLCREYPSRAALVAPVKNKATLILCSPAQRLSTVVDAFRAETLRILQFNGKNKRAEQLASELFVLDTGSAREVATVAKSYQMPFDQAQELEKSINSYKAEVEKLTTLDVPGSLTKTTFLPSAWQNSAYRTLRSLGGFQQKTSGEVEWAATYENGGDKAKFEQELTRVLTSTACADGDPVEVQHVLCPFKKFRQQSCASRMVLDCLQSYASDAVTEIEKLRKVSTSNETILKSLTAKSDGRSCAPLVDYCIDSQMRAIENMSGALRLVRAVRAGLKRECMIEAVRPGMAVASQDAIDRALASIDSLVSTLNSDGWDAFQTAVMNSQENEKSREIHGSYFSAFDGYKNLSAKDCTAPGQHALCKVNDKN